MKSTLKFTLALLAALLLTLPALAQGARTSSSEGGTRGSGNMGSGGGASISSRGIASTTPSVSTTNTTSRTYSSNSGSYTGSAPSNSGSRGYGFVPNPQYSSFNSLVNYFQWQDFYYYLQTRYYMNNNYFGRFYRNREPLVTPELLKLTVRQPLKLSLQLLNAVDDLEMMVKDHQAGKPSSREAIAAKSQEIRDLAKQIRNDQSLAFIDQRRDKSTLKSEGVEPLGLEAIAQLREIATDLNIQLKEMYTQSHPSTISVESLTAPSFGSLTKGIDRLSKTIENSARRM